MCWRAFLEVPAMDLHLAIFLLCFHQAISIPISQLNGLDGPSPIENKDDDSESFINVLHVEDTSTLVTIPEDIVKDITDRLDEGDEKGTDKPLRIGVTIEADESTTTVQEESTTEENNGVVIPCELPEVTTTEQIVNIGFKNNLGTEEPLIPTTAPAKNIEIVTEETTKSVTENEKVEARFGEDENDTEEPKTEKLQSAVFNGVFAIGRSAGDKTDTTTSPKPGSFGSVFLNLAKKYDSRYKYKYSWSFSGVGKTLPKNEKDGPLFSKEFIARLAATTTENIHLDTVNLGETGSITRDNPKRIAAYKSLSLYGPSNGSFL